MYVCIQLVTEDLHPLVKRPGREAHHSPDVKIRGSTPAFSRTSLLAWALILAQTNLIIMKLR